MEIEEHPFPASKARELLKEKAKEDGIEKISGLLSRIEDKDRFYYISDVCRIYRTWQNERLAVEVYPQYKNVYTTIGSCKKTEGNAYSELQSLIGLGSAKQVIQQALDYNRAQFLYEKAGLKKLDTTKHMVFTGNPGTAKTTVARLFAQIMKDNRVLSRGNLIEVGRQDLVGKYVGWTAKCVEEAFDNAMGSVLFIDEAYSLFEAEGGYYGDEAINTIVQLMENRRDNTIVIFAGYPDKMQQFLDRNPGLRSRIAFHVNFDDYSTEELVDIFRLMASKGEMNLAPGVEDKVFSIFNEARKRSDFGNGRYVRNIFEQARMKQASRIVKIPEDQLTDNAIRTLVAEDFDSIQSSQPMHDRCHIGFAC